MKIAIHPLTADPTAAWRELSQHQKVVKINTKLPTTEAPSDKVCSLIFNGSDLSSRSCICVNLKSHLHLLYTFTLLMIYFREGINLNFPFFIRFIDTRHAQT